MAAGSGVGTWGLSANLGRTVGGSEQWTMGSTVDEEMGLVTGSIAGSTPASSAFLSFH